MNRHSKGSVQRVDACVLWVAHVYAAKVRVLVEWSDHRKSWSTVGVSDNVIEASWNALVDAIRLELMRLTENDDSVEKPSKITAGACSNAAAPNHLTSVA